MIISCGIYNYRLHIYSMSRDSFAIACSVYDYVY